MIRLSSKSQRGPAQAPAALGGQTLSTGNIYCEYRHLRRKKEHEAVKSSTPQLSYEVQVKVDTKSVPYKRRGPTPPIN